MAERMISERLKTVTDKKNIVMNASMAEYTSFKTGGKADIMITPNGIDELCKVLKVLDEEDYPHIILGNGSNILVRDGGYRGAVVRIGDSFNYVNVDDERIICGSGALLSFVARTAAEASLSGFEFASGIPGSVGGAVFMNAGAYGGEMAQILEGVSIVSKDGRNVRYVDASELEMKYRYTRLHDTGDIVTEAVIKLVPGEKDEIKSRIVELTAKRNEKQPVSYPSAGSFFKRPEGYFAGALIQESGLKGLSVGGAQVSELHAGFIINKDGASATDILQLMEIVQATVMDKFGVKLEPEVRIIGDKL